MGIHKILKVILALVGIASLVIAGMIWSQNDALQSGEASTGILDLFMTITFIVLGLILALVLIFVLKGLFTGGAKNALIGIGAFAVVVALGYFTSSGVETPMKDGEVLSASGAHWVGAGINMFFILAAIAIGLMLLSGIKKLVK